MHIAFPYSGKSCGYFCHLQPGHCLLSLSQWCRTFIISVRDAAAASICVLTLPSGVCVCVRVCVCEREKRRGRGQSLLRDEIGEEEEEEVEVGRAEIERVVSALTVTESGPLSCCQQKNTEARINCTHTLLLFGRSSCTPPPPPPPPLHPLAPSLPLWCSGGSIFHSILKASVRVNTHISPRFVPAHVGKVGSERGGAGGGGRLGGIIAWNHHALSRWLKKKDLFIYSFKFYDFFYKFWLETWD